MDEILLETFGAQAQLERISYIVEMSHTELKEISRKPALSGTKNLVFTYICILYE